VKQIFSYPNVRIWKLVISDYFKRTPLETWDFTGKVRSSDWPVSHASDVLRFITLWKYGGTYLDMDFVIRK
jgi:lactosylceramide 4-alpha-galactosyltransferase